MYIEYSLKKGEKTEVEYIMMCTLLIACLLHNVPQRMEVQEKTSDKTVFSCTSILGTLWSKQAIKRVHIIMYSTSVFSPFFKLYSIYIDRRTV